jgi:protein-tyrosine-phosphatase
MMNRLPKSKTPCLGDKVVPDPYYDDNQFEPVFELIEGGCKDIIKDLDKNLINLVAMLTAVFVRPV